MERSRTVVGVDIAKRVFQLHWVETETGELMKLRLTRAKFLEHFANRAPCLVGMEACGGAQHWARQLLALGHEVRLLPAKMVRPFGRGNKNASSAESVGEFWFGQVAKCVIQTTSSAPEVRTHTRLVITLAFPLKPSKPLENCPRAGPFRNRSRCERNQATSFIGSSRERIVRCTSGRGTGRPSTATRSPTAIESPP